MILFAVIIPLLAALVSLFISHDPLRRLLLLAAAISHFLLVSFSWFFEPFSLFHGWIGAKSLELLFLNLTSLLFLCAAAYAVDYLRKEKKEKRKDFKEDFFFSNAPEANFTALLLLFLSTMSLVILSQHIGLMWVAVEATTLVSAPLICYHRHHRSLEAAWKYLLICSVGIGLALLGNFFLVVALTPAANDQPVSMTIDHLMSLAPRMDPTFLKASFLLMLVGYGTKMGLAPLHTWLPDAHSEAPSLISALLSGALLNCALLAVLRLHFLTLAAGLAEFSGPLLILFGLISMTIAAIFILSQNDYKRMLAYSSVEHMGIIAIGFGIGGTAAFGSFLHIINHSAAKAMLFFICGNLLAAYGTKEIKKVTGILKVLPFSAILWVAGLFMITGLPPFGLFVSEISILKGAIDKGYYFVAIAALVLLSIIFVSMASLFIKMSFGREPEALELKGRAEKESWLRMTPILCLASLVFLLGLYLPSPLSKAIYASLHYLGAL